MAQCRVNEALIGAASWPDLRSELGENEVDILGWKLSLAEEDGVASPGIGGERVDGDVETRTNGVEVDVANEFEQIGVFLDEDVLEAILEQVPRPAVDAVEGGGVGAEPALSETGEGEITGAQECVGMVGHESPGVEAGSGFEDEGAEAIKEAVAVAVGPKDPAALDAADDEMVHSTGTIEARAA